GNNSFGCTSTGQQILIVNPIPTVNVSTNKQTVCPAQSATLTLSGNANVYSWSTGQSVNSIVVSPPSNSLYVVTGTINSTPPCMNSASVTVNVFVPTLAVSPSTTTCLGNTVTLSASGAGDI